MLSPFLGVIDYSHRGLPQHVVHVDNGRSILASASHSSSLYVFFPLLSP